VALCAPFIVIREVVATAELRKLTISNEYLFLLKTKCDIEQPLNIVILK